jgi:hypothetical protein
VSPREIEIEIIAKKMVAKRGMVWKALDDHARRLWKRDAQQALEAVEEMVQERAA